MTIREAILAKLREHDGTYQVDKGRARRAITDELLADGLDVTDNSILVALSQMRTAGEIDYPSMSQIQLVGHRPARDEPTEAEIAEAEAEEARSRARAPEPSEEPEPPDPYVPVDYDDDPEPDGLPFDPRQVADHLLSLVIDNISGDTERDREMAQLRQLNRTLRQRIEQGDPTHERRISELQRQVADLERHRNRLAEERDEALAAARDHRRAHEHANKLVGDLRAELEQSGRAVREHPALDEDQKAKLMGMFGPLMQAPKGRGYDED